MADEKLVTKIVKINLKFGTYHTMDMLNDGAGLLAKCKDKREKASEAGKMAAEAFLMSFRFEPSV